MRQSDWDTVCALPLFCDMGGEHFSDMTNAAVLRHFPQHVALIAEGSLPDFLHVVISGSVEIFCSHDGHETTIDIIRPVAAFILAPVCRDEVYLSSARTLTPAQIMLIPAQSVRDAIMRDSGFVRAIVNELGNQYDNAVCALKNEKLRTGTKRLANWILRADTLQGNQRIIKLTVEKRTLASSLGMSPENLSRSLARLTRYGVRSFGRDIVIEDLVALEHFAKPNALIDG